MYIMLASKTEHFDHLDAGIWSCVGKGYLCDVEGLTLRGWGYRRTLLELFKHSLCEIIIPA